MRWLIKIINNYLLKKFRIDFTFLNIVNEKNMVLRLKKRKKINRYDQFKKNFYKNVQNGFIKLSKNKTKRYMIIDSNLNINANKNLIIKKIEQLIK